MAKPNKNAKLIKVMGLIPGQDITAAPGYKKEDQQIATPAEDQDSAIMTSQNQSDYQTEATEEEKSSLSTFLLLSMFDQDKQNTYQRSEEVQKEIDDALQYYQQDLAADNDEDTQSRIESRERHSEDYGDYDAGIRYSGGGGSHHATVAFGDMGKIAVGEKQNRVIDVLADAAAATGINANTMRGIWHVETHFSSLREVSSTGCSGAFQFTRGTWAEMMLRHGDEIAASLSAKGFKDDAAIALRYNQALRGKSISINDDGLQSQRFNGHIATYAAAHYLADIAKRNGIDASNQNEGGKLYAAFNVGEKSLRTLLSAQGSGESARGIVGRPAELNPLFYQGGATASEALANYQAAMDNGVKQYARAFGADTPSFASVKDKITNAANPIVAKVENATSQVFHAATHPAASIVHSEPQSMLASAASTVKGWASKLTLDYL